MAGLYKGVFVEKISPYLVDLAKKIENEYGKDSNEYRAIYNQYFYRTNELEVHLEKDTKHFEAVIKPSEVLPRGIERIYKKCLVIDLTMVCASHCRYCLRANYEYIQLNENDINKIVNYCQKDKYLEEILITGGDPFMVPKLLKYLISSIVEKAKNIKIIRIGTRLPVQNPSIINQELFNFFKSYNDLIQIEVGIQINHPVELQEEAIEIINRLKESNAKLYSQNVLLKGVNDDLEILIKLYTKLRYLNIEAHYLFHAVPMKGTSHLRTSVKKGLELIQMLNNSGEISGRIKPTYALMTYVGKVILYEGTLLKKDENNYFHINTYYNIKDRMVWNSTYQLPDDHAYTNEEGLIIAKYLDGKD